MWEGPKPGRFRSENTSSSSIPRPLLVADVRLFLQLNRGNLLDMWGGRRLTLDTAIRP